MTDTRIESVGLGSIVVLRVVGEHDLATVPTLRSVIGRYARPGVSVVVDVSPAAFIDSTVLHAVIDGAEDADRLVVVAPSGSPGRRLFSLTAVDTPLAVFECGVEALQHLLGGEPSSLGEAVDLLAAADALLDVAWCAGNGVQEALAVARRLSIAVGREPAIEDAKLLVADAQHCSPSEAFRRLVDASQSHNHKLAALARDLVAAAGDAEAASGGAAVHAGPAGDPVHSGLAGD